MHASEHLEEDEEEEEGPDGSEKEQEEMNELDSFDAGLGQAIETLTQALEGSTQEPAKQEELSRVSRDTLQVVNSLCT